MTVGIDYRTLARQRILSALDELVAQFVVQADSFERLDPVAPLLITDEVRRWISSTALDLTCYWEDGYQIATTLASITDPAD